jgi:hypothetical protein
VKTPWKFGVLVVVTVLAFRDSSSGWADTCRRFSRALNDGTAPHTAIFAFFS